MSCSCTTQFGNQVYGIPQKVGEPLSTACERTTIVGQIPETINFPNFTTVNGAVAASIPSDGGIQNMVEFFKSRKGCYYDMNARLYGSTCV